MGAGGGMAEEEGRGVCGRLSRPREGRAGEGVGAVLR